MKLQASELPLGKPQTRRKAPKIAPLIALTVVLTIIPIYYPSLIYSNIPKKISESTTSFDSLQESIRSAAIEEEQTKVERPTNHKEEEDEEESTEAIKLSEKEARSLPSSTKNDLAVAEATDKNSETWPKPSPYAPRKKSRKRPGRRQSNSGKAGEKSVRRTPRHGDHNGAMVDTKLLMDKENCDLFSGEWVPNPEGPYYTNATCWAIQEHQNCMKFGKPDTGFLKWRWKPDGCELPIFDPLQFLELVRGKSLAFVGDSVARNHMQSLICLLSSAVNPLDVSKSINDQNRHYVYTDYNFNISIFWAPYLVRVARTDPEDVTRPFNLYLDEFDEDWGTKVEQYDYVIISAGHWFFRPTNFYLNGNLVGCLYCPQDNVTHLTTYFSYRRAFRTAFRAINSLDNFKGVVFMRTFAPSHFEDGPWDKGGDCVRTRPFKRNEISLQDYNLEMYKIQLQELQIAQREGRRKGIRLKLFDATKSMLLRPDGHPSKYGHWQQQNVTLAHDCVHWCLPGPIDAWNDFLLELLKREETDRSFL